MRVYLAEFVDSRRRGVFGCTSVDGSVRDSDGGEIESYQLKRRPLDVRTKTCLISVQLMAPCHEGFTSNACQTVCWLPLITAGVGQY